MKLVIFVTFMLMQHALAYKTERIKRDLDNSTLFYSYICDDEILQNIEQKFNVIVDENKNLNHKLKVVLEENDKLHLKLDSLSMITSSINLQLTKLETTITNLTTEPRQSESTSSNSTCTCDQMMDILRNIKSDISERNISDTKSSQIKSDISERNISDSKNSQKSDLKYNMSQPTNCAEAFKQNDYKSGIYKICLPESKLESFFVYCLADPEQHEAPWTIIQRRQDGSVAFYRNWTDYQKGFGNLDGEFFIGLDILHALTQSTPHELWIQMEDVNNKKSTANYSSFAIGDSSEAYTLKTLGSFKGDVGDRLPLHFGQKFSTKDVDNDMHSDNCAVMNKGAWWYNNCWHSNLNGEYFSSFPKGVWWDERLKYVHMALRPVNKTTK